MSFQKVCSNLGFVVDLSFGHIQKGGIAVAHLHTRTPRFLASRGKTPETMASSLYRNFNITAKCKDDSVTARMTTKLSITAKMTAKLSNISRMTAIRYHSSRHHSNTTT